ncbi:hypothetical protein [Caulobacter segnis]|uniref:hypothetical protein n=1 Tax=Caulobacter segnis TaxID=88688 RepID=UPI002863164A|nr:hypothetical protein [Caulobacter segnis]MDR6624501.1 hypothetical protein [Caulobacter segnis]
MAWPGERLAGATTRLAGEADDVGIGEPVNAALIVGDGEDALGLAAQRRQGR